MGTPDRGWAHGDRWRGLDPRPHTGVPLRGEDLHTVGEFTVSPGEHIPFTLEWQRSYRPSAAREDPERSIAATERWWREWSDRCTYQGPYREVVVRSLITLKALTYRPSGGLLAAATTSLPERLGGVRNWDYRFCWLRDATFTLYALMLGGYTQKGWCRSGSSAGCPATRDRRRCAWATPLIPSSSSTSTVR